VVVQLADKGFTVSKSALQRYAVAHKNEILSLQEVSVSPIPFTAYSIKCRRSLITTERP
jgi:hypothetical protein